MQKKRIKDKFMFLISFICSKKKKNKENLQQYKKIKKEMLLKKKYEYPFFVFNQANLNLLYLIFCFVP